MKKVTWFTSLALAVSSILMGNANAAEISAASACDPSCAAVCESSCALPGCGLAGCDNACALAACDPACTTGHRLGNSKVEWGGYANAGMLCNTRGSHYLGTTNVNDENGGALNGLYGYLKKEANTNGCGTDWGFGADFMFGQDSRFMRSYTGFDEDMYTGHNSRGDATYGFAMPQLYAELAVNDWSVKAGHMYTLLGWESARADQRFFYSIGYGFQGVPVTQTGVLVSYNGFQNLDITMGLINGVNAGFSNDYDESLFAGKFAYNLNDNMKFSYAINAGDFSAANWLNSYGVLSVFGLGFAPNAQSTGAINTFAFDWQINDRLEYVAVIDYSSLTFRDYNINYRTLGQHLYYTVNDCWKWGARIEWLKCNSLIDVEMTSLTFGANWTPFCNKNFVVRPELRYDNASNGFNIFNNGRDDDQLCLGFDVMYKF